MLNYLRLICSQAYVNIIKKGHMKVQRLVGEYDIYNNPATNALQYLNLYLFETLAYF
jgi:hypothetical protein